MNERIGCTFLKGKYMQETCTTYDKTVYLSIVSSLEYKVQSLGTHYYQLPNFIYVTAVRWC